MKLGEAHGQGGLYQRIIGQYKICMSLKSTEFYLRYLVICPTKKQVNKYYRGKFYSQIMEKELLKTIDSKVEDSYSNEYVFDPSIADMEKKMIETLKSHTQYYEMAVKFEKDGFRIYKNGTFNTPLQNFNEFTSLNPDVNLLLGLNKPVWSENSDDVSNAAAILSNLSSKTVSKEKPKPIKPRPSSASSNRNPQPRTKVSSSGRLLKSTAASKYKDYF
jgi:hypothetical protein